MIIVVLAVVLAVLFVTGGGGGEKTPPVSTASPVPPTTVPPTVEPVTPSPAPAQDSADVLEKTITFHTSPYRFEPNPIVVETGKTYTFTFLDGTETYVFSATHIDVYRGVDPGEKKVEKVQISARPGTYPVEVEVYQNGNWVTQQGSTLIVVSGAGN